jgi:hypothetical protein
LSLISYLLKDGRDGNIADVQVNTFWTRVAMHPLNGMKNINAMSQGNNGIGRPLRLEGMRAFDPAEFRHLAG